MRYLLRTLVLLACLTPVLTQASPAGDVLAGTDAARAKAGLAPLTVEPRLAAAAQAHADDLAAHGVMSHTGSDGSTIRERLDHVGYLWSVAAENVAAGSTTGAQTVTLWLNSEGHRRNMLMPAAQQIGIGYAHRPTPAADGMSDYWVMVLAAPRAPGSMQLRLGQ